jgi:RNA-directed DNA polymerase
MSDIPVTPTWLLRPLPANAVPDTKLNDKLIKLCQRWTLDPESLAPALVSLRTQLNAVQSFAEYESAVNLVSGAIWLLVDPVCEGSDRTCKIRLIELALDHLVPEASARICRRLAKDVNQSIRWVVRQKIENGLLLEVALPEKKDGPWSPLGWLKGTSNVDLSRHKVGKKVQEANQVPPIATLKALRKLLEIRSEKQLGYLQLASDQNNGPYTTFTIKKRNGGKRLICAPKPQLKWVQRRIHEQILQSLPAHDAAHGFITGRSIVSNAAAHVGAAIVVKFDLQNFFPAVHYYRILGLFASLGYSVGDARFGTADDAKQVAPVLARLCCYTPDPKVWGQAHMPQGAPTSPAISNLVCRRLDSRLTGLASKIGGIYTRYADDLTFSFKTTEVNLGRFRWWIDQVCHQEGFFVNQSKFRVIRRCQRQMITGIVVNDSVRVPREDRRRFRAILHNCRKFGVASQARGNPLFREYLRGFASYLHMVHPEDGIEQLKQVSELLDTTSEAAEDLE